MSLDCFYSFHGLNYKSGYHTTCPTNTDELHKFDGSLPSEFWNSQGFRDFRLKLWNNQWPRGCHLCKECERDGLKSMRDDLREFIYPEYFNPETGEMDFEGLYQLEVRFNNSCNMACLHCDTVYSSLWESRLKKYVPTEEDHDYNLFQLTKTRHKAASDKPGRLSVDLEETKAIFEDMNMNFPNLTRYDCSGGEPLKQKQFLYSLELLAKHPNASNMDILMYTNFNADFNVDDLYELFKPFRRIKLSISIDAGKNIYAYFRDGSWDKLEANIKRIRELDKVNRKIQMKGILTYSIFQLMDIEDVYRSICSLEIDFLDAAPVQTPQYINPSLIMKLYPDQMREDFKSTREFIESFSDNSKRYESIINSFNELEQYTLNTWMEDHWLPSFFKYRAKIDKLWNKNFNNHFTNYMINDRKLVRCA